MNMACLLWHLLLHPLLEYKRQKMQCGERTTHTQSINRHKPHMSPLYLFPTPLACASFLFHLWGHHLAQKLTWHISCEDTLPRVPCHIFHLPAGLCPYTISYVKEYREMLVLACISTQYDFAVVCSRSKASVTNQT